MINTSIKISYDPVVDAARISWDMANQIVDSESLTDDIIVDYDKNDTVVAVEILGVERNRKGIKEALQKLNNKELTAKLSSLVEGALQTVWSCWWRTILGSWVQTS